VLPMHASVISIAKPGKDHSNPSKYRPKSMLSSVSKIFEKIILERLEDFVCTNNVLPDHLFGFRMTHSMPHQREEGSANA
jgi:hypothetical protein